MPDSPPQPPRTAVHIAHVGIAVRALSDALPFYRDVLGLPVVPLEDTDGAHIVGLAAGDALVELLESHDPGTPIGKFIERRGPGMHHMCFAVPNLGVALERCRAAGVRLIDDTPRTGADGKQIAFIHPSATGGVLIELTENESPIATKSSTTRASLST